MRRRPVSSFFFFNDTATTEIYTLSLHDALPIWARECQDPFCCALWQEVPQVRAAFFRSEEHTSELQSHLNLVCRLLLEKKKQNRNARGKDSFLSDPIHSRVLSHPNPVSSSRRLP